MADEPVIAPDQRKPGHPRAAQVGAIITIGLLLAMTTDNDKSRAADYMLIAIAALLALILIVGEILRRTGISR